MEPYGTSNAMPRVIGEHSHHFTFDKDTGLLEMQILTMLDRGTEAVRDNNVTGIAQYHGNDQAGRDELFEYYFDVFCPALLNRNIMPFPVLLDRNWLGDWENDTIAGLDNGDRDDIYTHASNNQDHAVRILVSLAAIGPSGGICDTIRAALLADVEEWADAAPQGVWFQLFNGPENTRVCGEFGSGAPWDFTPDSMCVGSTATPTANRAWALSDLGVTMTNDEATYKARENEFFESVAEVVESKGHPRTRLIAGGVHPYVLSSAGHPRRCLGAPDPDDFDTIPENAVMSEFGVPRWNGIPLNDPDVVPRPLLWHAANLIAKKPRAMFLHSPVDGRRLGLWHTERATIDNWTAPGFKAYLIGDTKDPEPYNALQMLEDEPHLPHDIRSITALFRHMRDVLP